MAFLIGVLSGCARGNVETKSRSRIPAAPAPATVASSEDVCKVVSRRDVEPVMGKPAEEGIPRAEEAYGPSATDESLKNIYIGAVFSLLDRAGGPAFPSGAARRFINACVFILPAGDRSPVSAPVVAVGVGTGSAGEVWDKFKNSAGARISPIPKLGLDAVWFAFGAGAGYEVDVLLQDRIVGVAFYQTPGAVDEPALKKKMTLVARQIISRFAAGSPAR